MREGALAGLDGLPTLARLDLRRSNTALLSEGLRGLSAVSSEAFYLADSCCWHAA